MRYGIFACLFLVLSSCAVVDSSDFRYLDDENVELYPMLITGPGRIIEISLPKSLATDLPESILMKPEGLESTYTKALDFPYEWSWGGPAHEDKGLYLFELGFTYDKERKLLSEGVQSRIQNIRNHYEEFEEGTWRDYVLKKLLVEGYQSQQGYQWVVYNLPTVMRYHEMFQLPISNERQLVVWFWYNEDWVTDHPEWFERRKALSRRILDTIKLSEPNEGDLDNN